MKRQETTNTFNGGMIMDLNPLVTPNDVLVNCLNGTLITFNGNENVLQNDMGNGRVESAFLPAGYVPVGIKEHGGIVYVASCNPLTGKGQIGSFPSPERNISSTECESSEVQITQDDISETFIVRKEIFNSGTVIRSGDKFKLILESEANWDTLMKYISNMDNSNNSTSIKCYKNKLLTLSVSVKDNNNNLIDITKDLVRVTKDNELVDKNLSPELYFNTGYFATFVQNNSSTPINLDQYRNLTNATTYNNKIFGQLYLTAKVNTVQAISVSVYGKPSETDNQFTLTFQIEYQYNCPDGYYTGNQIYGTEIDYGNGLDDSGYKSIAGCAYNDEKTASMSFSPDNNKPVYDKSTNLYRYTQSYEKITNEPVVNYTITPVTSWNVRLDSLSVSGTIDTSQIGTGKAEITSWRYRIEGDDIRLGYGFELYPLWNQIVDGISLELYDMMSSNSSDSVKTIQLQKRISYNGTFYEFLDKNDLTSKLYLVKINATYKDINSGEKEEKVIGYRFILTTGLFNEYYFSCIDFKDVPKNVKLLATTTTTQTQEGIFMDSQGSLLLTGISDPNQLQQYTQEHKIIRNYTLSTKYSIENQDLYPFDFSEDSLTSQYKLVRSSVGTDVTYTGDLDGSIIKDSFDFKQDSETSGAFKPKYSIRLDKASLGISISAISKLAYKPLLSKVQVTGKLEKFINDSNVEKIFGFNSSSQVKKWTSMYIRWNSSTGPDVHFLSVHKRSYTSDDPFSTEIKVEKVAETRQEWEATTNDPSIRYMYNETNTDADKLTPSIIFNTFDNSVIGFICSAQLCDKNPVENKGASSSSCSYFDDSYDRPRRWPKWQLALWRTIDGQYVLIDNNVYILGGVFINYEGGTTESNDVHQDIAYAIEQTFSNTYLVQDTSQDISLYGVGSTSYIYNNDYNVIIESPITIAPQTSDQPSFVVGNEEYNTYINKSLVSIVGSESSLAAEIAKQIEFIIPDDTSLNYTFQEEIPITGMSRIYEEARTMLTSVTPIIFEDSNGNISMTDTDGNYFTTGQIYEVTNGSVSRIKNLLGTKYAPFEVRQYNGMNTLLAKGGQSTLGSTIFLSASGLYDNQNQHTVGDMKGYQYLQCASLSKEINNNFKSIKPDSYLSREVITYGN